MNVAVGPSRKAAASGRPAGGGGRRLCLRAIASPMPPTPMTTATSRTGEERSGVDMSRASPHELAQRPHADGLHSGFAERARGEFRPVEALLEAALMGGLRRDRAQLLG